MSNKQAKFHENIA